MKDIQEWMVPYLELMKVTPEQAVLVMNCKTRLLSARELEIKGAIAFLLQLKESKLLLEDVDNGMFYNGPLSEPQRKIANLVYDSSNREGIAKDLTTHFSMLRMMKEHHLGLGDIRLTFGQQEEIIDIVKNYKPTETERDGEI